MDGRWRIELLGGLGAAQRGEGTPREAWRGGGAAEGAVVTRFRTQKTGMLLGYLAYSLPRAQPREVLIELLWPEREPQAGRQSLSQALCSLRQQLEPPGAPVGAVLRADRTFISLNPAAVTTDVGEFEAALEAAERAASSTERVQWLTQAVELYRGELLRGYSENWVLVERVLLAERYFQALRQLVALLEEAGDLIRALQDARRGVSADPLREEAHRELMRLHAAAGQPEAGLRQCRELERILQEEFGDRPAAATRALAGELAALAADRRPTRAESEPAAPVPRLSPLHPSSHRPPRPPPAQSPSY